MSCKETFCKHEMISAAFCLFMFWRMSSIDTDMFFWHANIYHQSLPCQQHEGEMERFKVFQGFSETHPCEAV